MWVRIPHTVCLRFLGEGSSALGKSGPKIRPKGVVDGHRLIFLYSDTSDGVTDLDNTNALLDVRPSAAAIT